MSDLLGDALARWDAGDYEQDDAAQFVAAARSWHALPSLIRQFAFDIVMTELGMSDDDMDDQADATERVDTWMRHWRSVVGGRCSDGYGKGEQRMSHGICNRCGYPIAEPAPAYVRCGNAHRRIPDLMTEAVQRQMQRADASRHINRQGWTQQQWIEDADRLMAEVDGAITSLVNGHVLHLLDYWRATSGRVDALTVTAEPEASRQGDTSP